MKIGIIWFVFSLVDISVALLEGIYCGKQNCYDVLGVERNTTKSEISKKYRNLAKKYHPDAERDRTKKEQAAEQFKIIATAYEVLKDEGSRADYDYMLDNPDEYYSNFYRYYRRRVTPQVDVRIVIFVTITIISIVQYYSRWQNYELAIQSLMEIPKYRHRALQIAEDEGLLSNTKRRKVDKAQLQQEKQNIIKMVIKEKMDIKGAYAKPVITEILWLRIILLPYTLAKFIYWYSSWFFRHTVLNQPYDEDEKLYIIRKYLKMSHGEFETKLEGKKQEFLSKELWIRENFTKWFEKEQENAKKQLAENNRYKQYRRYMKNHGIGRMTFDDS